MLQNERAYVLFASIALQWFFWGARRSKILTGLKGQGGNFIIAGVFETLHLIKQFKQQPWAGDRVAQLQILLCGRSLEICLGVSRYTNTPGFLKLTSKMQNYAVCSLFLLLSTAQFDPSFPVWPEHLLSVPGCALTDQPQPRKAVASSLIECSAWVLRCRSGISSVLSLWAQVKPSLRWNAALCLLTGAPHWKQKGCGPSPQGCG